MHNHEKTWPYWKPESISTYRTSTACNSPSLVHVKTCTHTQSMRTEGKKQKEQKFSTHVYTYGTAKRVSMSALRRVLYGDWEFGYDFWQKSLPAWNWLKVLITAFTMARVRYLWQNCPCKEVTMQEYHTYLVPILHYIIFKNIRLEQFSTVSVPSTKFQFYAGLVKLL